MWELDYKESWALKNWCFWTVVLEKTLESPWTARRFNQSILKEISPEYSLEGLMLKLKLQYFGHLMWRTDSLEKTLMLGKIEGGRRRGWQRMRWLDGLTNAITWTWVNSGSWWWTGRPGVLQPMGLQRVGRDWATELVTQKEDRVRTWEKAAVYKPKRQACGENKPANQSPWCRTPDLQNCCVHCQPVGLVTAACADLHRPTATPRVWRHVFWSLLTATWLGVKEDFPDSVEPWDLTAS